MRARIVRLGLSLRPQRLALREHGQATAVPRRHALGRVPLGMLTVTTPNTRMHHAPLTLGVPQVLLPVRLHVPHAAAVWW